MQIPSEILLHKQARELELKYESGVVFHLPFEFLRVFSPSAEVQGHHPSQAKLQVGKRDVSIVSLEGVGSYALKIVFSDGHDSGLYTWDYFVELGEKQDKLWETYLEQLTEKDASRDPEYPGNEKFREKPKTKCAHH